MTTPPSGWDWRADDVEEEEAGCRLWCEAVKVGAKAVADAKSKEVQRAKNFIMVDVIHCHLPMIYRRMNRYRRLMEEEPNDE